MGHQAKVGGRVLLLLASLLLASTPLWAQTKSHARRVKPLDYSRLVPMLGFELRPRGNIPGGWTGGPAGTVFADSGVVHSGHWSVRLERNTETPPKDYTAVKKIIPIEFAGTTIELRGFLRTEDVENFSGLWMREEAEFASVGFVNMQGRQLKGTTPWTEYSIKLHLDPQAKLLHFGVIQSGTGKTWADDLQLLVDDKPIWEAPRTIPLRTALELDHQFDEGSGISIRELSHVQIENLALLGKVWGFLKYYDSGVTEGRHHWDYELFRVMPETLKASDQAEANATLSRWIASLGDTLECAGCAMLSDTDLYFGPDLDWIAATSRLGVNLSSALQTIRDNRVPGKQFYVSKVPGAGNASFDHELPYGNVKFPDAGFQLLALFRFWNAVEYWSPDRDLVETQWNTLLTEFVPRFALAKDEASYKRELLALLAELGDGHANLWDTQDARPPAGRCEIPVDVRFVENKPVIRAFRSSNPADAGKLKIGDVITKLDGKPVSNLVESWKPYYSASNEAARLLAISRTMTRGACGETKITVRQKSRKRKLTVKRVLSDDLKPTEKAHDLPGPAFRMLSNDVAYLKISSAKASDARRYIQSAAETKGLIIDIRDYPTEFMVFALGSLLVESETPFARVTQGDLANPGAFHWAEPISLHPAAPHYPGKIVILVDETSMSAAEYAALAFRSAPKAIVVGSTTAGADGNVSTLPLPGGVRTMISGVGVFYPDKTPTQRVGIVPNVQVRPTIAGIRQQRDEVLEEALRQILGAQTPAADIARLASPSGWTKVHF